MFLSTSQLFAFDATILFLFLLLGVQHMVEKLASVYILFACLWFYLIMLHGTRIVIASGM